MRRARSLLLAALVVGLLATPAQAAVKSATMMRVDPVAPVAWGERALVTAHLALSDGSALGNVHVDLHINGEASGGRTDATGKAIFTPKPPVNPGTYTVTVTFNGSSTLLPSQAYSSLTVKPRLLTIHTMPAAQGLPFVLDGTQFVSDAQGIAQTVVPPSFDETTQLPEAGPLIVAPGIEERFARWRTLNGDIVATYEMYYGISLKFIDLAGNPIDPARVTKVTFKSAIGALISVAPDQPFTVLGQRVVALAGEFQAKDITYAAQDVVVDGSSVIHVAQQRFTPSGERVWTITLLFYAAHFSVRDALFGFPIDATVGVTYPDGHEVDLPTSHGELSLVALARGDYHVAARGFGIAFSRPVSLSRDQQVELKFISYLDVGVVVTLVLLVALGLVALGRTGGAWYLALWLRRRLRPVPVALAATAERLRGAVGGNSRVIPAAPADPVAATLGRGASVTSQAPFTPGSPMPAPGRATRAARSQAAPATEPIASRLHAILATEPMATRLKATRVTRPQAAPVSGTLETRLEATRLQAARATERARIRPQATPVAEPAPALPPAPPDAPATLPAAPPDAPATRPARTRAPRQAKAVPATAVTAATPARRPSTPATTASRKPATTPRAKPAAARTTKRAASPPATPAATPAVVNDELLEDGEYVVQRGDTLKGIAAKVLGSADSWEEIVRANPDVVIKRGRILPGTRLKIR